MIKNSQRKVNLVSIIIDFLLILISYFGSMLLRYYFLLGYFIIPYDLKMIVSMGIIFSLIIIFFYYFFGLYNSIRFTRLGSENLKIVLINAVGALLLVAFLYIFKYVNFSRWVIVIFWVVSSILIIAKRAVVRATIKKRARTDAGKTHIAVVGYGSAALKFVEDVKNNPYYELILDGYISPVEVPELGTHLGNYDEIDKIVAEYNIGSLVVALGDNEMDSLKKVLAASDKEGVRVELIPFYHDVFPSKPVIEIIGKSKLIDLRATPLDNPGKAFAKRLVDIVVSALMIIILSPLMLATAIAVKISSPGPVLFKQERVGRNKKPFTMLKFRSMRNDTDHQGWSTDDDPRKTKFGSFIRKFSIDELPQLFNVFVGQMSLVGPRPEMESFVLQFKNEVPMYMLRHQIRPGMTGWAQINGLRGDTAISERIEYDIYYIHNWSMEMDISIMVKTLCGGFINKEKISK